MGAQGEVAPGWDGPGVGRPRGGTAPGWDGPRVGPQGEVAPGWDGPRVGRPQGEVAPGWGGGWWPEGGGEGRSPGHGEVRPW